MAANATEVATASNADIAADMAEHRRTYRRFLRLLRFAVLGISVPLLILFIAYAF